VAAEIMVTGWLLMLTVGERARSLKNHIDALVQ
jgi:hypothetical protein